MYSAAQVDDFTEVVSAVAESEEHLTSFTCAQAEESSACRSVSAVVEETAPMTLHEEEKLIGTCSFDQNHNDIMCAFFDRYGFASEPNVSQETSERSGDVLEAVL